MNSLRQLLPSFRSLVVFEAAGRLGSFTRAGQELGMTQAAVSYAIKALEDDLGQALFERAHRKVRLTEAGRVLHNDVAAGLGLVGRRIEEIRVRPREGHVTLSVSTAFATLWMVPHMQAMRSDLPDIELRLHTADRDLNIVAENIPLGVRGGRPEDWSRYESLLFAPEEIVAVASPDYLKRYGEPQSVDELPDHNLAHLDEPFRKAVTWQQWLKSAGVERPVRSRGLRANEYVPVLQTALDGDAIALGWKHLIGTFLANGRLVQVTDHCLVTGEGFHLVWPRNKPLSNEAMRVRDWIAGAAGGQDVQAASAM